MKKLYLIIAVLLIANNQMSAQTLIGASPYIVPASGNYTIPAGVTSISVECIGGGGAGAGTGNTKASSSGGGGGAYVQVSNYSVLPGGTITVQVGAGGTGTSSTPGANGSASYVIYSSTTFISAAGGTGGSVSAAGAGGQIASNIPANTGFNGGTGGNGVVAATFNRAAGGGGGGAGTTGAGNNGSNGFADATIWTGGAGGATKASLGGSGGTGAASDANCPAHKGGNAIADAANYGGGGGGCTQSANACGTASQGGNGARGLVRITYCSTGPLTTPTVGTTTQPTCTVSTGSVALSGLPSSGTWTLTASPGGATLTSTGTTASFTGLTPGSAYTFIVSQGACLSAASAASATIAAAPVIPAAPTVSSPVSYCKGVTAVALTATGSNLLWYTVATGGTGSSSAPTPSTATVGTVSYWVSQTVTCESARSQIDVNVTASPSSVSAANNGPICVGDPLALTANGTELFSYKWDGPGSTGTSGQIYQQDFSLLPTTGSTAWTDDATIPGWYQSATTALTASTGSTTTTTSYNFGIAGTNVVTDRALGSKAGTTAQRYALKITNNTGASVDRVFVSYAGERWRIGSTAQTLVFAYQVNAAGIATGTYTAVTSLDFATSSLATSTGTAVATDGNDAAQRAIKSATVNVTIPAGSSIWLRWSHTGSLAAGAQQSLAIDDVKVILYNSSNTLLATPSASVVSGTSFSSGYIASDIYTIPTASASHSGTFTLTAYPNGGSGCAKTATTTVTVNAPPTIATPATPVALCSGGSYSPTTPSVTANGSSVITQGWQIESAVGSGTYTTLTVPYTVAIADHGKKVRYTATNGCGTINSSTVTLTVNALPTLNAISNSPVCAGSNLQLNAQATGAATLTYNWSGPNSFTNTSTGTPNISNASSSNAGVYNVTVTDGNGCSASDATSPVTVNALPSPTANNGGPFCIGQDITLSSNPNGATTYAWSGPSSYTVANTQNPTRLSATTAMAGNYTVTVTDGNGCTASSTTSVVVSSSCASTWLGGTSTDWGTASNWSPSFVPNACAIDVTIPSGTPNPPTISGTNYSVGSVTIASGVNLTLTGNNLSVCGNWNAGTGADAVTIGTGNIVFQGGTAHTISGNTTFNKVTLNDAAGASLAAGATVDITDRLNLQAGALNTGAGTWTFKSTSASQCATIDHFSSGYTGTISGNIHAERYVPVSGSNQHYISSPVDNLSLAQFGASGTPGFVVPTANCDETQLQSGSPYGTVFQYHEDQAASCALKGWEVKTAGSTDNARGYSVYLPGLTSLAITGTPQLSGSVSVGGLTNTGWANHTTLQGRLQSSGWNLVGNPFLANLDLGTHAGFDNQVQVWVTSGPYAGTYQASLMGSNATIAPFQGFMVHKTTVGNASFTISKSECSNNSQQFFKTNDSELEVVLSGNGFNDKTNILFNADATPAFDPAFDANKIHSKLGQPTLYTLESSNAHLAINTYPSVAQTVEVPLSLEPGKNGQYSLSFDKISTFDPTQFIYLEDKKAGGAWVNVRSQTNYIFQAATTDNWDRFVLHFTPALNVLTTDAVCEQNGKIELNQAGTADWSFVLDDDKGTSVSSGSVNANKAASIALPAGIYTLNLTDKSGYTTSKAIQINGTTISVNADFSIPPSSDAGVAVQLTDASSNNSTPVGYTWDFGDGSSIAGIANPVHTYANAGTYSVVLTIATPEGCKATISKSITVRSKSATGIDGTVGDSDLSIYAVKDKVFVNFEKSKDNIANIKIYSIIGQELSNEMYSGNGVYTKNLNLEAAYVIVTVKQKNATLTTRKVFITNN